MTEEQDWRNEILAESAEISRADEKEKPKGWGRKVPAKNAASKKRKRRKMAAKSRRRNRKK